MKIIFHFFILSATLWAISPAFAQNYVLSPNDTLIVHTTLDNLEVANFTQIHQGTDSLYLSWQKISKDSPSDWAISLCDIGHCYTNLPDTGNMYAIPASDDGLMSLHVTAHSTGTAVIRYALWDATQSGHIDTLTWIVNATLSAIEQEEKPFSAMYVAQEQLYIEGVSAKYQHIQIVSMQGEILFSSAITAERFVQDISFLSKGIFCVMLMGKDTFYPQKIIYIE
jgi:hypothetical protein